MKIIENLLLYLFPKLLLRDKAWYAIWEEQECREFNVNARIFFGLSAAVYVLHYFTVDRGEGLAPSELWFNYRFGMATIAASCFLFYSFSKTQLRGLYKIPTLIACGFFCYFQTRTIIWYPKVPYLYSFAFVLISAMILRTSTLKSVIYAAALLILIQPSLVESGQSPSMMFSASVVTIIFVIYMKSKYRSDLNLFIANQKNIDSQKKIIEINLEFTDQIKSFLPSEIADRLTHKVQSQRMTVIQAIDDVLRPRKVKIACLFSDIRGFTKGSNDLNGFVAQSLIPNLKATTTAAERFKGIPRKIGDLLFAYFDNDNLSENITNALKAALEISMVNRELNDGLAEGLSVKRYILLSAGEAIVGNLSGYDSNIEITAIGRPVNLLSRMDELTKNKKLQGTFVDGDIIMSNEMFELCSSLFPSLQTQKISLHSLGLNIRDFEDVDSIYKLPINRENYALIFNQKDFSNDYTKKEAA